MAVIYVFYVVLYGQKLDLKQYKNACVDAQFPKIPMYMWTRPWYVIVRSPASQTALCICFES